MDICLRFNYGLPQKTGSNMGTLLSLGYYAATLAFLGGILSRFLILWKAYRSMGPVMTSGPKMTPAAFIKAAGDMVFLGRLLKVHDVLWAGEWIFHWSLVLVVLRHLRYFFNPVPGWIAFIQPAGIIAGCVLPLALIYILTVKLVIEKGYAPSYNFFLLALILLTGATGILLRTASRTDITQVKIFVLGILSFRPEAAPGGLLFIVHYMLVLLLVLYLPSHIFTAPFVMLDAREREEELKRLIHEE